MYISFKNTARNFIRLGESIQSELVISSITPVRLTFGEFPGYRNVVLDRNSIGAILRLNLKSRRTALSVVKGIYVLTDRDGENFTLGKPMESMGYGADGNITLVPNMAAM